MGLQRKRSNLSVQIQSCSMDRVGFKQYHFRADQLVTHTSFSCDHVGQLGLPEDTDPIQSGTTISLKTVPLSTRDHYTDNSPRKKAGLTTGSHHRSQEGYSHQLRSRRVRLPRSLRTEQDASLPAQLTGKRHQWTIYVPEGEKKPFVRWCGQDLLKDSDVECVIFLQVLLSTRLLQYVHPVHVFVLFFGNGPQLCFPS